MTNTSFLSFGANNSFLSKSFQGLKQYVTRHACITHLLTTTAAIFHELSRHYFAAALYQNSIGPPWARIQTRGFSPLRTQQEPTHSAGAQPYLNASKAFSQRHGTPHICALSLARTIHSSYGTLNSSAGQTFHRASKTPYNHGSRHPAGASAHHAW